MEKRLSDRLTGILTVALLAIAPAPVNPAPVFQTPADATYSRDYYTPGL